MISPRSPLEWQDYANNLLSLHYGPANWTRLPDQHKGDAGLEGYSSSGHAYQCYAPQGVLEVGQLSEKHRKKIYTDTKKFIDNEDRLTKLLGSTIIKRWVLFVPHHVSSEVVAYCNARRSVILEAALPYVDDGDFGVKVSSPEDFPLERSQLANAGVGTIRLGLEDHSVEDVRRWIESTADQELIETLRDKLVKLPRLKDEGERRKLEYSLLRMYLRGHSILNHLKTDYSDLFERIRVLKAAREGVLEVESQLSSGAAGRMVDEMRLIRDQVAEEVPALSSEHHSELALHFVADWLLRCPLDFPKLT